MKTKQALIERNKRKLCYIVLLLLSISLLGMYAKFLRGFTLTIPLLETPIIPVGVLVAIVCSIIFFKYNPPSYGFSWSHIKGFFLRLFLPVSIYVLCYFFFLGIYFVVFLSTPAATKLVNGRLIDKDYHNSRRSFEYTTFDIVTIEGKHYKFDKLGGYKLDKQAESCRNMPHCYVELQLQVKENRFGFEVIGDIMYRTLLTS